ncbi:hypothetical protein BpHYR1_003183 [Brachionus plicatilis]|uniref:Uncharacterized protein n=1 Tax=Brachionus plicatilis TaxID=10195 RepID=A0A3M7RP00_BRAPC|nr:hypothetical protein BpHYR1_003183 [Brachionus plicatilis]
MFREICGHFELYLRVSLPIHHQDHILFSLYYNQIQVLFHLLVQVMPTPSVPFGCCSSQRQISAGELAPISPRPMVKKSSPSKRLFKSKWSNDETTEFILRAKLKLFFSSIKCKFVISICLRYNFNFMNTLKSNK